ncbi:MAG: EAL domain-containing protein [Caulobacteraceae bacterium]
MVVRRQLDIQTAIYVIVLLVGATFVAWEFDVFHTASRESAHLKSLQLEEVIALAGLLTASMVVFGGHYLRQKRDNDGRVLAEREARRLALEDPLTGLPNRRQFEEALKTALGSPPRAGGSHGVLLLDLNGFKRVNDVHGHPVGDEVLSHVGNRLKAAMRESDLVARLGGDEFAVLAPHLAGPEAATGVALRIIEHLKDPITIDGRKHSVGSAIGIALAPQDADSRDEVMRRADIALYRAKGEGRFALRFFEPEMDASVRERDRIECELRLAMDAGDIQPFYQPIVDLKTGAIIGFEALARWTHAELGVIDPSRFIPIAEDCGLIGELTDQLLERACRDAAAWTAPVVLSFNISPVQLRDQSLGLRILGVLARAKLPPHRLEIEITESALVQDLAAAQTVLGALREAGVKIALDDFGTGYSSLYHLRNFKLDKIKIDRSFVEAMCVDPESAAIVKALIGLGSGLSLAVTAEGVESAEQQSLLVADGCLQAQGFLFSRALPAAEAAALLPDRRATKRA